MTWVVVVFFSGIFIGGFLAVPSVYNNSLIFLLYRKGCMLF